jgi:hypothetical protein
VAVPVSGRGVIPASFRAGLDLPHEQTTQIAVKKIQRRIMDLPD